MAGTDQPRAATRADSAALAARIARGDGAAFGAFYELWFDRVFALARSISRRDEAFCLDVVQDAMLRAARSLPRLRDEAAVETWLARVVTTTTLDRLRGDDRRARRERVAARDERHDDDPAERLEHGERLSWLQSRLGELEEAERALLLARFDGGTLRAIGATAGISGDSAHGRVRRALVRLRRKAEELWR